MDMDAESFTNLTLRVISREATIDECHTLEAEMASAPARREEFEQLKLTHEILRTTMPMTEAMRTTSPELPAYRVNELRTAVRQHFGPAANRPEVQVGSTVWAHVLRWVFGGGSLAALGFAVAIFCFANRTIQVGLYSSDQVRGSDTALSPKDVPSAQVVTFESDAPFDQWQNQPLAWNEHAKIWVDNERDLLHIVRRVAHGQITMETQPLAPTSEGQREQIKQVVESLKN
jgi:hypothetical protein